MLKALLLTLSIVGVILISGYAWAKHNGYCPGGDFMKRVTQRVSAKLDLNENQQAQLQQFTGTLTELREDWAEDKTQLHNEVKDLLSEPALNRNRLIQLLDERHRVIASYKAEVVHAFADFSDSLQPEQRAQLSELVAKRMEHHPNARAWAH